MTTHTTTQLFISFKHHNDESFSAPQVKGARMWQPDVSVAQASIPGYFILPIIACLLYCLSINIYLYIYIYIYIYIHYVYTYTL